MQTKGFRLCCRGLGRRDDKLIVVGFADCFTVPARTFGVDIPTGEFLIALGGPLEGTSELVFFDLVIVVDEFAGCVGGGI